MLSIIYFFNKNFELLLLYAKQSSRYSGYTREPTKGSPGGIVVKKPLAKAGDIRDMGSIPGLGRFPAVGSGNPLQYSCLGSPTVRGALWAAGPRVANVMPKSRNLPMTTREPISDAKARECLLPSSSWGSQQHQHQHSSYREEPRVLDYMAYIGTIHGKKGFLGRGTSDWSLSFKGLCAGS